MADHGCINGSLDDVDYSGPVPVIGLYIAAASLLCMLLMLYDIGAGFLARKRWLPCNLFTLNSVTLTLLSVAAKLPVDLTTSMPRPLEQLSKLTGTAIICISMGFIMPSLGVDSESESLTNLVALSIFVVTIAVNICMQLYTEVIVLFFVEHIIVLGLMFLLLLMLWHISFDVKTHKKINTDRCKDLLAKGHSSMFERLKRCYSYAYCSNPQFDLSMHAMSAAISTICLICAVIVVQATLRSIILKKLHFCQGASDYRWSMLPIVIAQVLTVLVGTCAVVFRWLALFRRMEFESIFVYIIGDDGVKKRNKTLGRRWNLPTLQRLVTSLNKNIVLIAQLLIVSPSWLVRKALNLYQEDQLEYFDEGVTPASWYIVGKSVEDVIRLREDCTDEPLYHLAQFISQHSLSENLSGMEISDDGYHIEVCSLSMALLVKIAQVSIPKKYLGSLVKPFKEANEIIHFIDETIQFKSEENSDKLSYAKAVWTGGDFTSLLPTNMRSPSDKIKTATEIIKELKKIMDSGNIGFHLGIVVDFINRRDYNSVEELYVEVEQLFVDMLHGLLAQLPIAIFKSLRESPGEELEDRARVALKYMLQTGSFEKIVWKVPENARFSSFADSSTVAGGAAGSFLGGEGPSSSSVGRSPFDSFLADEEAGGSFVHDEEVADSGLPSPLKKLREVEIVPAKLNEKLDTKWSRFFGRLYSS